MPPLDTVDGVAVTVVVTEYADYESPLLAQHGLSLLCDARRGRSRFRILVDAGQRGSPVAANLRLMGVDPSTIDAVFLSHSHFDHTHGLEAVLDSIGSRVPVVAHPLVFRTTLEAARPVSWRLGLYGPVDRPKLEAAGAEFLLASEPLRLAPGVTTSGVIQQTVDCEKPAPGLTYTLSDDGRLVSDLGLDDLALIVNVAGEGLVLLIGCGHAGLVNTIRTARAVTGVDRVAGVIGGFHLLNAGPERIRFTVRELEATGARVIAGHCTGFPASAAMAQALGDKFSLLLTGKRYEFGAGEGEA